MTAEWVATYRLQLHVGFNLSKAAEILPYLAELGISHVYLSPCLQAVPGSQHGYDVADPTRISEDLGGEAAWKNFVQSAHGAALRLLLDIVPNHMAASEHNPWWENVLAHGPYSSFADFFDIRSVQGQPFRLHICSLARAYGAAIEAGELKLEIRGGYPRVSHYGQSWPLSPVSWGRLLAASAEPIDNCFATLERLQSLADPTQADRDDYAWQSERARESLDAAHRAGALQRAMEFVQTDADALDAVLQRQFFTLHDWRLGGELTNYRLFFDVSSLIGLRMELPQVMTATHARIEAMIQHGDIDGLRVDHPDGLRRPYEYFTKLRALLPQGRIYVEKILENDERLPEDWAIDGTVGYDFMARVNRLWMDDQKTDVLTATYQDFTGHSVNLGKLIREKKYGIIGSTFAVNMDHLGESALKIARANRRTRDLSPRQLREALARLIVTMPVYRTYRTAAGILEQDARVFTEAIQSARMGAQDIDPAVFDFLAGLFTQPQLNAAEADFVAKWQQLAPAVMAKGVEDTAFYCFDRLISCNEVGSQASLVGISADKFHEFCHYLGDRWPHNMLATSTHDNKRSEDVRTRISILSEIPERWSEALHQWSTLNATAWRNHTPDRHAEYLLYQTLIGAWPIDRERSWQYMLKACREAKINTSWHEPNTAYEESVRQFIDGVYESTDFIADLERFVEPLIQQGRVNSLAQTLIKMVAPGLPDFYQGSELWDLSLVDPDNRRPVDFALRYRLLREAKHMNAAQALSDWDSGLPKLWMIGRTLALRTRNPALFAATSPYQPLVAQGSNLGKVLAFRRGEQLIAVVPRLTATLSGEWGDTRLPLPGGEWHNCFTEEIVEREASPAVLFKHFPVALLRKGDA
jgi:(1->4)-alpha-D-glucan 1-alpha-D-glucosylmutase